MTDSTFAVITVIFFRPESFHDHAGGVDLGGGDKGLYGRYARGHSYHADCVDKTRNRQHADAPPINVSARSPAVMTGTKARGHGSGSPPRHMLMILSLAGRRTVTAVLMIGIAKMLMPSIAVSLERHGRANRTSHRYVQR